MKRDLELIRKILLKTEAGGEHLESIRLDGYEDGLVRYHVWLLENVGYVNARANRLTWAGCDYLDSIRNQAN